MKWYRKAAEQDFAPGQFNLALAYEYGDGATKDLSKAVEWYRKAAEQGMAEAQCNLGVCYANGLGLTKDNIEACKWLLLASVAGSPSVRDQAAKALNACKARMSRNEISEAQRLARNFKSRKPSATGALATVNRIIDSPSR